MNHHAFHNPCPLHEEAVNLYADGELPFDEQGALFRHLADCDACRFHFDALLQFRLFVREERLDVPSSVDEAFFRKLALQKRTTKRYDRKRDRQPLWAKNTKVSLRAAVLGMLGLFVLGWWFTGHSDLLGALSPQPEVPTTLLEMTMEDEGAVYVIIPGITVEGDRLPADADD